MEVKWTEMDHMSWIYIKIVHKTETYYILIYLKKIKKEKKKANLLLEVFTSFL